MTEAQIKALVCLQRNDVVFAGRGNMIAHGSAVSVSAMAIEALARRGYCVLRLSPDGGMCGVRP